MYEGEYTTRLVKNRNNNLVFEFKGWDDGYAVVSPNGRTEHMIHWKVFRKNWFPMEEIK